MDYEPPFARVRGPRFSNELEKIRKPFEIRFEASTGYVRGVTRHARPMSIAKHMEYVKNLVGAEAVSAGSDYVYNDASTLDWILRNPEEFPPEMGYATPSHMGMPGEIWGAVKVLEDTYGWTRDEILGLLGENLLRVYKANWR